MVKRRKGKYTPPPENNEPTALPGKKCVGYSHHFPEEPLGMPQYICQCGIFIVTLNQHDGTPLQIEPVPDLNPDNKIAERVSEYREV
jgi:hypothetical protein